MEEGWKRMGKLIERSLIAAVLAFTWSPLRAEESQKPISEQVTEAAAANAFWLDFDGAAFSGPAFDRLVEEGRAAQFFLLGEEHGIAENPKLAAALFAALAADGYSQLAIEISPPMARELDSAARDGVAGLKALYAIPGGEPAFFGMKEEGDLAVAARSAVQGDDPVLVGLDYEVFSDRILISRLESMRKPKPAEAALAALKAASEASWREYDATRNLQLVYSFSGDPALVRAVAAAWPKRSLAADEILRTLEETLEINRLWASRQGYLSNLRRSVLMRENFLRHWRHGNKADRAKKTLFKFGSSHMVRGRSMTEVFDLGTLLPEIAALEGKRAFHLLVLPGANSETAVFDPAQWRYTQAPPKDHYSEGLEPLVSAALPDAMTLIDLRPLRSILRRQRQDVDVELMRVVHGYDMALIMTGSTASSNLADAP
jgi:hypothetical protein